MKPEPILVPIDVAKCPLEVFELVNGFAKRPEVTVILLHVVNADPAVPVTCVHHERGREARRHLRWLADNHIQRPGSAAVRVRMGEPGDQILAEAKGESADLIILPSYGPSFWSRLKALWRPASRQIVSTLVEKVIREATCGVFVVLAKTRLNCERLLPAPRPAGRISAAIGRLRHAETTCSTTGR